MPATFRPAARRSTRACRRRGCGPERLRARPTAARHDRRASATSTTPVPASWARPRTSSGSPRHSRGSALSSSMSVPRASTSALRTALRNGAGPRVESRCTSSHDARSDGRRAALRRANMPRRSHTRRGLRRRSPSLRARRPPRAPPATPGRPAGVARAPSRPRSGARDREGRPASPGRGGRATRGRPARHRARPPRPRRRSAAGGRRNRRRVRWATGNRNAASSRAPRSRRGSNASSRASPFVTTCTVEASSVIAHLAGGRVHRIAGRRSTNTVAPSVSTCAAPRTTSAATNGAGDSFTISTTAASGVAPYTCCTASPPGTRIDVVTTGMPSTSAWRTATSSSGRCQRSSAPIHQAELPAGALGLDRAGVVDDGEAVATEEAHEMTRSCGGVAPSSRGHRRPCNSGFASRNMSSETRSAGWRPS